MCVFGKSGVESFPKIHLIFIILFNFGTLYVQYEKARKRAQKNDTTTDPLLCEIKALFYGIAWKVVRAGMAVPMFFDAGDYCYVI